MPQGSNRAAQSCLIGLAGTCGRRTFWPKLTERKVAAEHRHTNFRESGPKFHEQRRLAITASSVCEHESIPVRGSGTLKKSLNRLFTRASHKRFYCCRSHISPPERLLQTYINNLLECTTCAANSGACGQPL